MNEIQNNQKPPRRNFVNMPMDKPLLPNVT